MATRYESQVAPQSPRIGGVGPAAFGAEIGQSLYYAGEIEERIRRRRDDDELASFGVRFAEARTATEEAVLKDRAEAPDGGAGHAERVRKRAQERRDALLANIKSERVRRRATEQLADWESRLATRELEWEEGARVGKLVRDVDASTDISANRARRATDPAALGEEIDQFDQLIDGLSAVPADVRAKLQREGRGRIVRSYLEGLNGRDPRQAAALLESGAFDAYLQPQEIDVLTGEAGVEIRREEVEMRAKLAAETAEARETVNLFQKRLADGVPVPDAELEQMQALAQRYGLDADAYDLAKARVINGANRVFRAATPQQIDAEIKTLDARIAKAGDKARPADVILRDHLSSLLSTRTAELDRDPLGYGARAFGMNVEPIDFDDPASIQKRLTQAHAVARATGRPPQFLTDEEAADLSAQLGAGGAGRSRAAEMLARLGPRQALAAARQVAPDDDVLQRAVTLGPKTRTLALIGPDYRKANPKLVPAGDSQIAFQASTGRALRHLGGEFSAATLETARNIYAGLVGRNGGGQDGFDDATFGMAVNMALGASRRNGEQQGGIGSWNGRAILLPTDMTQREFDGALARVAGPISGASNGTPIWGDGSPIKGSQIREGFVPVAVRDGVYRFENARGQVLTREGGGAWLLDIRKLKR